MTQVLSSSYDLPGGEEDDKVAFDRSAVDAGELLVMLSSEFYRAFCFSVSVADACSLERIESACMDSDPRIPTTKCHRRLYGTT